MPVQLVSFSLMAPYRVGENDDGRENFDRTFPAKELKLRMNNHERSIQRADGTNIRSKASRVEIYLHIFHRAGVTRPICSGVALFASVAYARGT